MGLADVKRLDTYNTRGGGGYRDQLRELMEAPGHESAAEEASPHEAPEPGPGSTPYLQRRQKQGEADLRGAGSRGR